MPICTKRLSERRGLEAFCRCPWCNENRKGELEKIEQPEEDMTFWFVSRLAEIFKKQLKALK